MKVKYFFKKLKHLIFAKHYKAHGIHSPFMFDFLSNIVFDKKFYKEYSIVENCITIPLSLTKKKYGRLLFRIVNNYSPRNILEIYSFTNSHSHYFSSANNTGNIYRLNSNFCDSQNKVNSNKKTSKDYSNISKAIETNQLSLSKIKSKFEIIFINSQTSNNEQYIYIENLISLQYSKSIIIISSIHKSESSELFWNKTIHNPKVRQSLDLFEFGIVFLNQELQKEDFIVKYY